MNAARKKWKICTDYFPNCEYIYPLQQKKAKQILDYLKEDPDVLSITIFGSSITERCHIDSDLDIYVEITKAKKFIRKYFDFTFDLWTNFTVDERLLKEIKKTGLVLYDKRSTNENLSL